MDDAIPYFLDGADVAETTLRPFGAKGRLCRLIVRRVRPTPGSQLALFTEFSYHAFSPTGRASCSCSRPTTVLIDRTVATYQGT